jgi:hypothetical protein
VEFGTANKKYKTIMLSVLNQLIVLHTYGSHGELFCHNKRIEEVQNMQDLINILGVAWTFLFVNGIQGPRRIYY